MSSETSRKVLTDDSNRSPQNVFSSGVSAIIHSASERLRLFSKASAMRSTGTSPDSKESATHSSPQSVTLCLPLL